ncbi:hypothetical protein AO703_19275 [[Enterobacter] lignolyticus]|uniref:Uncharacterized protein n=1 Tax=[Enterobacter] lignolyticus TaxID=1334193 RepID=A0A806XH56_9ENTR|nr:hypothetical protein AO703_19275 [[Enterobacter] lignolyticus]
MALGALPGYRLSVNNKLAIRVAIAGMEGFTEARTALNQMALMALRTRDGGVVRLIDKFRMLTLRVAAAADEHPEAPLPKHQFSAAGRT